MILQSSGRQYIHNEHDLSHGPIIWWIQRDQRLIDNWTYFAAANEAARLGQPIVAVFCLSKNFLGAQPRFFDFMLLGLKELFSELAERAIPLIMLNSTGNIDSEPDDLLAKL
ncbi:MAG: deoxyribodipyrimidine photo-lyase, partial [Clostridiaceae bacterium]|nr:deoxyribodipyrimidine photo-lyase [Clostridiaceae bacterium]